jgi:hypothetical protein
MGAGNGRRAEADSHRRSARGREDREVERSETSGDLA